MSGSARNVAIRVSAEEVDSARSRLEALGDVGDRALRRVETAAHATRPDGRVARKARRHHRQG